MAQVINGHLLVVVHIATASQTIKVSIDSTPEQVNGGTGTPSVAITNAACPASGEIHRRCDERAGSAVPLALPWAMCGNTKLRTRQRDTKQGNGLLSSSRGP